MIRMFSRAGRAAVLDRRPFTEAFFDGDAMADAAIVVSLTAVGRYLIGVLIGDFASASRGSSRWRSPAWFPG